jgi:hypothetical protein
MTSTDQIKNGDVFDISQTINGVSQFMWLDGTWYYFTDRFTSRDHKYEYDQNDLTRLVLENEFEEVAFIKNIFVQ